MAYPDDDPSILEAQYRAPQPVPLENTDPAAISAAYDRSAAQQQQEANLLQSISPASGIAQMRYTQGSQVGVPVGESGGIATFGVQPRPEPTPTPHQFPGLGERIAKGFLFGIAGMGREYLMDLYHQKNRTRFDEERAQTATYNKLLQSGIPITPKMGKALNLSPEEVGVGNMIADAQSTALAWNAQTFGQMFPGAVPGAGQGYGVLAGAPQGAPAAAPPAPPPGMPPAPPTSLGGGPTALTAPAAGPLTATPEMAPGPLLPGVQGTRLAPTSRDILTPPPPAGRAAAAAPAAPRGPVDLATAARGLSTMSRGKMHGSLEVAPGVKITAERSSVDPADTFLGLAQAQGATPVQMSNAARAGGLPITEAQHERYGKDWFASNYLSMLQENQKLTDDPMEAQQMTYRQAMSHGYLPAAMQAQALSTQADVDKMYLGRIATIDPKDFAKANRLWTVMTRSNPSPEVRKSAEAQARRQLITTLGEQPLNPNDPNSPPLKANPAALAQALVYARVATPEDEQLARSLMPIDKETQEQIGRDYELQPLARGAGKTPPPGAQETLPQRAFRQVQERNAQKIQDNAAGVLLGHDKALPETTIPNDKLYQHVIDTDLSTPKPGSKYKVVQGESSPYKHFIGTPAQLSLVHAGRDLLHVVGQQLAILKPVMERGGWSNVIARAGASGLPPFTFHGPLGTQFSVGISAGSFSDETAKKWLKESFKNDPQGPLTDADAEKYARAMVRLNLHTQEQGLHYLRLYLNEIGQGMNHKVIEQGVQSLPSMTDNWMSGSEKYRAMLRQADTRERSLGLTRGREAWPFQIKGLD